MHQEGLPLDGRVRDPIGIDELIRAGLPPLVTKARFLMELSVIEDLIQAGPGQIRPDQEVYQPYGIPLPAAAMI